ncbi:ABC-type dipeptide/oligopeptide/nickel transport system, permease component [Halovivax ruber XH-70]|uniref:ABC-type dipeptide/oligopeptide/nickel transport system, permease component n=1 Tax=Halovivax ruber (strain DSM 18193 / JCM 13892 / XH-70) TaxID=797302 RepID=L0IFP1_HALRX|nr:ABC transporter permease [Halovivax ruber]AGB17663.1 ABC-type dipeptide/oligopeptide/nickel transport system, permease component [Halovivax ruber XH-70]
MGLLRYTTFRVAQAIPVLIGITAILFLFINLTPGDPIRIMTAGQEVSEAHLAYLEQRYGLDRPLYVRYWDYLTGILTGDLGRSIHFDRPVTEVMWPRVGPTLLLVLSAFLFAMVTAIPLGILAATRRNEPTDHISRLVALFGVSTPSFWIGIMLIIIFAVQLGWFPSAGLVMPWHVPDDAGVDGYFWHMIDVIHHLFLPMVSLGTLQMATIMRVERTQMIDSLQGEYVKLARAYGVSERTILRKHAFQVAQLPVITLVGLGLSTALGGAVLTETVFNINGMGRLLIDSIGRKDYQVVMSVATILAVIFVVGVIITDIAYAYVDPRVTYGEGD